MPLKVMQAEYKFAMKFDFWIESKFDSLNEKW